MPGRRKLRVQFIDEAVGPSSPLLTWATSLHQLEVRSSLDSLKITYSGASWLAAVSKSEIVVLQLYKDFSEHTARMMALALSLGRPVVRKWSGTDVLRCLQDEGVRARSLALDKVVTANLTESPHLSEELAEVGISCAVVPPVLGAVELSQARPSSRLPTACLVYLPDPRLEFYGLSAVEAAVKKCPELHFVIVGDQTHRLAQHPNVESLGWVEDMKPVWDRIGALLRITEHDGTPRMVTEALARGKHVIYSWPMEGSILASSTPAAIDALKRFSTAPALNIAGIAAGRALYDPQNVRCLRDNFSSLVTHRRLRRRLKGFAAFLKLYRR